MLFRSDQRYLRYVYAVAGAGMNGVCIGVISLYDRQVAIIRGVFCCRKGVHRKLTASAAFTISIRLAKFSGSTQIQNLEESCKRCKFLSLPILAVSYTHLQYYMEYLQLYR